MKKIWVTIVGLALVATGALVTGVFAEQEQTQAEQEAVKQASCPVTGESLASSCPATRKRGKEACRVKNVGAADEQYQKCHAAKVKYASPEKDEACTIEYKHGTTCCAKGDTAVCKKTNVCPTDKQKLECGDVEKAACPLTSRKDKTDTNPEACCSKAKVPAEESTATPEQAT